MDIVVDANILFAILIKQGITERILLANELHCYAPEYLFAEFKEHEKDSRTYDASISSSALLSFLNSPSFSFLPGILPENL